MVVCNRIRIGLFIRLPSSFGRAPRRTFELCRKLFGRADGLQARVTLADVRGRATALRRPFLQERDESCGFLVNAGRLDDDLVRQVTPPDFAQERASLFRIPDDDDLPGRREVEVNRAEGVAEGRRVALDGVADEAQDVDGL